MTIDLDAIRERSRKEPGGWYTEGPSTKPIVAYSYLEAIVNRLFKADCPWYVRRAKGMDDNKAIAWLREALRPILAPAYQAQQDRRDLLDALDRERGLFAVEDLDGVDIHTPHQGWIQIGVWRAHSRTGAIRRTRLWSRRSDAKVFILADVVPAEGAHSQGLWQWVATDPDGANPNQPNDLGYGEGYADERWMAQMAADAWLRNRLLRKEEP
jgi:hypothetical protein